MLKFLPDRELCEIGKNAGVDRANHKILGAQLLKISIYALSANRRISLRTLAQCYNASIQTLLEKDSKQKITHAALADRLSKINLDFFESIFNYLSNSYFETVGEKEKLRNIMRFDSTLVSFAAKLFAAGMKHGNDHLRYIKITICQRGSIPVGVKFFTEQNAASEDIALKKTILETEIGKFDIALFDRGIMSGKTYGEFSKSGIIFIARTLANRKIEIVENFDIPAEEKGSNSKILADQKVYLGGSGKERLAETPLRIVRVKTLESEEELWFITNNFELSAHEVASLYRHRWDIEVFFRFIKQELSLGSPIAHNKNGIKAFVYLVLIFAILFLLYKKINNLKGYKIPLIRFFNELEIDICRDVLVAYGGDLDAFDKDHGYKKS